MPDEQIQSKPQFSKPPSNGSIDWEEAKECKGPTSNDYVFKILRPKQNEELLQTSKQVENVQDKGFKTPIRSRLISISIKLPKIKMNKREAKDYEKRKNLQGYAIRSGPKPASEKSLQKFRNKNKSKARKRVTK